jgi:hypothetical protein
MKMYKVTILYFPQIILMGVFMGPRTGNIDALNDASEGGGGGQNFLLLFFQPPPPPPPCGNNASMSENEAASFSTLPSNVLTALA